MQTDQRTDSLCPHSQKKKNCGRYKKGQNCVEDTLIVTCAYCINYPLNGDQIVQVSSKYLKQKEILFGKCNTILSAYTNVIISNVRIFPPLQYDNADGTRVREVFASWQWHHKQDQLDGNTSTFSSKANKT